LEGFAFGCVGLFAICVALWLPIALIAILGGSAGLLKDKQRKGATWVLSLIILGGGIFMLLIFVRNKYFPEPPPTPEPVYGLADEAVEPFLLAINQSDRLALGFSPIPTNAKVIIQEYDSSAMAYITIGSDTDWGVQLSWNVYFDKSGHTYKWVGEEETYAGPNPYENIYISYFTDSVSPRNYIGGSSEPLPQNTLVVEYRGEDSRLIKPLLYLSDVQPILNEWKDYWDASETNQ